MSNLGLEPYQFEPIKEIDQHHQLLRENDTTGCFLIKHWETLNIRIGSTDWCECNGCVEEKREIDCLCCREVDAITDEQFSGSFYHYFFFKGFF